MQGRRIKEELDSPWPAPSGSSGSSTSTATHCRNSAGMHASVRRVSVRERAHKSRPVTWYWYFGPAGVSVVENVPAPLVWGTPIAGPQGIAEPLHTLCAPKSGCSASSRPLPITSVVPSPASWHPHPFCVSAETPSFQCVGVGVEALALRSAWAPWLYRDIVFPSLLMSAARLARSRGNPRLPPSFLGT